MASQSAPFSYVPLHPRLPAPLLLWDGFAVGPILVRPFAPLPFDLDAARRFLAFLLPKLPADRLDGKPWGPPGGPRGSAGVREGPPGGPRGAAGVRGGRRPSCRPSRREASGVHGGPPGSPRASTGVRGGPTRGPLGGPLGGP